MLQLNPAQQKATEGLHGATLVIAGAGSGKTRVITARIARLIAEYHAEPASIVALTFTNKAANEMKERVASLVGESSSKPFVGTFHSYCLRLLRSNPTLLGDHQEFSVIDTDDQATLVRRLVKKYGLEKQWSVGKILHLISAIKNQLPSTHVDLQIPPFIHDLINLYEKEKAAAHSFDFDDLILKIFAALDPAGDFASKLRGTVRHLLVDEYQDTNTVQHELLRRIALDKKGNFAIDSLCAVGDQDQSIYSWRGAVAQNVDRFLQEFSPRLIKVEQNYRSVQPILHAANTVITNNKSRVEKKLWSDRQATNRILNVVCKNEYHEAEIVAHAAQQIAHRTTKQSLGILYRTHAQSRVLEEALIALGLPYTIVGGLKFYERMEIKDLLAYLRLVHNPFDRISFFRIFNTPPRGLGEKCEEFLLHQWETHHDYDFKQLIETATASKDSWMTPKRADTLRSFAHFFATLSAIQLPSTLLQNIITFTDYKNYLRTAYDEDEAVSRIQNVDELARSIEKFEERAEGSRTLADFLHEVALVQEESYVQESTLNTPKLMTLHSAKGLEFDTVIITGNEEGTFPSGNALEEVATLEEERRLFYVGITRAKERLIALRAHTRNKYGRTEIPQPSRFLAEMPKEVVMMVDAAQLPFPVFKRSLTEWLNGSATPPTTPPNLRIIPAMAHHGPAKATTDTATQAPWKKHRTVVHATFGPGVITDVKKLLDGELCLTVTFKSGSRKVLAKFVNKA